MKVEDLDGKSFKEQAELAYALGMSESKEMVQRWFNKWRDLKKKVRKTFQAIRS